jgi:hypothetical protein
MDYENWLYIGGSDMGIVEYDPVNEPYQVEVQSAACVVGLVENLAACVVGLVENLTEVDYANARLIAAAPDLLEACEAVIKWINAQIVIDSSENLFTAEQWQLWTCVSDAVAKAKGE